jgi:hypothetical protein
METPLFVKAFGWFILGFININDSPSLLWLLISSHDSDLLSFRVFSVKDLKAFTSSSVKVAEVVSLVLEDLEPS